MVEKQTIPRHSKKDIEKVLVEARTLGWIALVNSRGHGITIVCPHDHPDCIVRISSTPRVPGSHAKDISRAIARCPGE